MSRNYQPPANDYISQTFEALRLVPRALRGSDRFLDVLTWNLRYFHDMDAARVKLISDILSVINADLLVLEEIKHESLKPVVENLANAGAGYYDTAYGTTGGNQRVAFMWDLQWIRSKADIKELVQEGQVVASDGKDAFPRLPLWGYFTALSYETPTPDPFDFQMIGVHLKSQRGGGEPQRKAAASWLARWLETEAQRVDSDVLIEGDWNEGPDAGTWSSLHEMEDNRRLLFKSINNKSDISHLYYQNKSHLGSRLDLVVISIDAAKYLKDAPRTVKWAPMTEFLAANPKAAQIKKYWKRLGTEISDHLPVLTRFYFARPAQPSSRRR